MENKDYYVYVYFNQTKLGIWRFRDFKFTNQPFYVGKGRKRREIVHLCPHMRNQHNVKNSIIKSIFNKCSESPIHFRIYENLTNSEAIQIEKEFIKKFGRIDNKSGILANGTDGGDGANNFSVDTKRKISENKKKKPVYQYDLSGNFIQKFDSVSEIKNSGNISTAIKRDGTFSGYSWSYDFKEFLEPKIKYQMPIKFVNIKQIDMNNNVIHIFENALEIEKKLKLRSGARNKIYECINGKLKSAYGYKWEI
jgi:hypothetical protein